MHNNSAPRHLNGSNEVDVRLAISTFRSKQRDSKAIAMLQLCTMYLNDRFDANALAACQTHSPV
jgi:hypothetical protein